MNGSQRNQGQLLGIVSPVSEKSLKILYQLFVLLKK